MIVKYVKIFGVIVIETYTCKKSVSMITEVNQPPGRIIKLQMQMVNGETQRGCTKWTLICARSINHNPGDSASKDVRLYMYERVGHVTPVRVYAA